MAKQYFVVEARMAEGFLELGDAEEAARILAALPPKAQASLVVLMVQLQVLIAQQAWQNAQRLAASLCRIYPSSALVWYRSAIVKAQLGKLVEARQAFLAACERADWLKEHGLKDERLAALGSLPETGS